MDVCWIGIGANVGDPHSTFAAAWKLLAEHSRIELLIRSELYSTNPVGEHAGGTFTNAVFSLSTDLAPLALLELLQRIESELGRTRTQRWSPRPIDLDLLFVGQQIVNEPRLTLPHPAAWYRRFVGDPMVEIAPDFQHPVFGQSVGELRDRLLTRPLIVATSSDSIDDAAAAVLRQRCPEARLVPWEQDRSPNAANSGTGADLPSIARPSICVRLYDEEPAAPFWHGVPVADLTTTPGDELQRMSDFLQSVVDQPARIGNW